MDYLQLTYAQVGCAAVLILINGAVSIWLRLGLEKPLIVAAIRTVVQLILIGVILQWVFQADRWYIVVAIMILMTLIAGYTAVRTTRHRYRGIWIDTLLAVWVSSWALTAFAVFVVLQGIDKWYQPQYVIPLLGMILGNTLNGISIGLSSFTDACHNRQDEIETRLSLGATRWEACAGPIRQALRTGMMPIINSMMTVGVVSLPGMMTGQLLSGTAPSEAVKYQIAIMFLIASATAIGTAGAVLLSFLRLFNADHQYLDDRIRTVDLG